jgi:hypothetical protein
MTAEKKKGKYVYYRCTGFKGKCGNQRRRTVTSKLDRGYDDFVSGRISEEFWPRKSRETVLSNCTFDCGSLYPTYNKPFDLLVRGNETEEWRGRRDSSQAPRERRDARELEPENGRA